MTRSTSAGLPAPLLQAILVGMSRRRVKAHERKDGSRVRAHERHTPQSGERRNADPDTASAAAAGADSEAADRPDSADEPPPLEWEYSLIGGHHTANSGGVAYEIAAGVGFDTDYRLYADSEMLGRFKALTWAQDAAAVHAHRRAAEDPDRRQRRIDDLANIVRCYETGEPYRGEAPPSYEDAKQARAELRDYGIQTLPQPAPAAASAVTGQADAAGPPGDRQRRTADELFDAYQAGERDFSGWDLSDTDLTSGLLSEANLSGANLTGATLVWAVLDDADLSHADLSEADLACAECHRANFHEANMARSRLGAAELNDAVFTHVDVTDAHMDHAVLDGANVWGTDLSKAAVPPTPPTSGLG